MNAEDKQLLEALGLDIGTTVAGKYRIEALIASGGMGAVLRAHHEVLDQTVAIKVMRPELASNREAAQRFLREARAAAKVASDYVCRVTDVDLFDDATPYMVMEHLHGEDLDSIVESPDEVAVTDAVDYIMQALAGLEAAHAIGVVHRDLKPSNLFLVTRADGTKRIKVLDFGISKVMGDGGELKAGATTSTEAILGTPRYMSPEQISSAKDVDARTDLWAIGLILYELLTKRYPFEGETAGAILASVLTSDPPPIRQIRRDVPPGLHAAVHRCLAKNREHRFAGARQLLDKLGPFASRRVQALLLKSDVEDPITGDVSLDPEEMPTLEASVAAALGQLDISQDELNAMADAAVARETAASAERQTREAAREAVGSAATEPPPPAADAVSSATANTALSIHQPAADRSSSHSRLIGFAAAIAISIFAAGVWVISRGPGDVPAGAEPSVQPAAETKPPPTTTAVETAPDQTAPDQTAPEPSDAASVAVPEPPQPSSRPEPIAAKPSPIAPKPVTHPVPVKPKPNDLDALLGERD